MTLMDQSHLQSRRGILPGIVLGTVTLYRTDATDTVIGSQEVEEAEIRPFSTTEQPGLDGPTKSKTRVFHLWTDKLDGWEPEENDYLNYETEWWSLREATPELQGSRWRVSCEESSDPN